MTNTEIRSGEYVRTIDGKIYKTDGEKLRMNNAKTILFKEITKIPCNFIPYEVKTHSSNLKDLIEVGDYVNGYLVEAINYNVLGVVFTDDDFAYSKELKDINIHSIVTKEQFKAMEYKVGGEDVKD